MATRRGQKSSKEIIDISPGNCCAANER